MIGYKVQLLKAIATYAQGRYPTAVVDGRPGRQETSKMFKTKDLMGYKWTKTQISNKEIEEEGKKLHIEIPV